MSGLERNKGRLIPYDGTIEDIKKEHNIDDSYTEIGEILGEAEDYFLFNGIIYKVDYEVKSEEEVYFSDVEQHEDGTISFHSIHYNSYGLWDVLEKKLEKMARSL